MIKTKCIKSCVAATGCCWLLFGWFVASIFDHYSFVYRMCLTIKKGTQKEVFSSLLVVVAQGIIEPPNSENIQEAKRIKKPSKIPSRLKPPENLINLISACVHRLNSFDLRFPSRERNSSSLPFPSLTTHSRHRANPVNSPRRMMQLFAVHTRTHTGRSSSKFFQFFRVHSIPFTVFCPRRSCSFQGQIITFDNYWIISLIYFSTCASGVECIYDAADEIGRKTGTHRLGIKPRDFLYGEGFCVELGKGFWEKFDGARIILMGICFFQLVAMKCHCEKDEKGISRFFCFSFCQVN